jgi:hypothetical protein
VPEFSSEIVSAVLTHMNEDHPEDSLLIARAFADVNATTAQMTGLDQSGGLWEYAVEGKIFTVTVPWSGPIAERAEIRREIVVLYDTACERLGVEPRPH